MFFVLRGTFLSWGGIKNDHQSQLLETEYSLAKSPHLYFILDIGEKRIDLKAKGLTLRTWRIEKIRLWGDPVLLNPVSIVKKTALFAPKREEIKPEAPESEKKFELEALELSDMPPGFTLNLENNISIYVRPDSKGWISFFKTFGRALNWHLFQPLKTVLSAVKKIPYTAFDIRLENRDESRSFYWAAVEDSRFIILPPRSSSPMDEIDFPQSRR